MLIHNKILLNLKKILLLFIINLLPKFSEFDKYRGYLYSLLGVKSGKNFKVASSVFIYSPEKLIVGDNCYIGVMTLLGSGSIKIGNNVLIGNNVNILPSNHTDNVSGNFRFGEIDHKGVEIDDNCWLCAQSIIVAGVKISNNTKVAAGAIVLKSNTNQKFLKNIYK
jgi:acetyltransferase-like isoleucine patch superfamily enzyme